MSRVPQFLVCVGLTLGAPPVQAGDGARRLCPDDAPEGVRLPPRDGCPGGSPSRRRSDGEFHEVGGFKVRVGGRVTLDHDMRR
ncbi:hypothetical protein [Methylobacterium marchantiae]|uniref:Porin n=1 Tax=Methylobacterium marchantiae TaxID=600331 RepID=A0ABW3WZD3_9HYPH